MAKCYLIDVDNSHYKGIRNLTRSTSSTLPVSSTSIKFSKTDTIIGVEKSNGSYSYYGIFSVRESTSKSNGKSSSKVRTYSLQLYYKSDAIVNVSSSNLSLMKGLSSSSELLLSVDDADILLREFTIDRYTKGLTEIARHKYLNGSRNKGCNMAGYLKDVLLLFQKYNKLQLVVDPVPVKGELCINDFRISNSYMYFKNAIYSINGSSYNASTEIGRPSFGKVFEQINKNLAGDFAIGIGYHNDTENYIIYCKDNGGDAQTLIDEYSRLTGRVRNKVGSDNTDDDPIEPLWVEDEVEEGVPIESEDENKGAEGTDTVDASGSKGASEIKSDDGEGVKGDTSESDGMTGDGSADVKSKLSEGQSEVKINLPKLQEEQLVGRNIIIYGAPGTGKSWTVDQITKGNVKGTIFSEDLKELPAGASFRTTFHPDTDYASFVGCYKPTKNTDVDTKVANPIIYDFRPQTFLKAYMTAIANSKSQIYLVVEEINRGNCAQIFGDIFQLLDRKDEGTYKYYSNYIISPDEDIIQYLDSKKALNKDTFNAVYVNEADSAKEEIEFQIDKGVMALPNNLCIIATMNTSDQSLFPMDSAFKRRWEWNYQWINYSLVKDVKLIVDNKPFKWSKVLKLLNDYIKEHKKSTDKQLGEFFIKAKEKEINYKDFRDKVLFFLFNDVFKGDKNFASGFYNIQNFTFEDLVVKKGNGERIVRWWIDHTLEYDVKANDEIPEDGQSEDDATDDLDDETSEAPKEMESENTGDITDASQE